MVESQMLEQIDARAASWSPGTLGGSRILIFPSCPPPPAPFPAHPLSNSSKSHFIHVQRLLSSRQKPIWEPGKAKSSPTSIMGLKPAALLGGLTSFDSNCPPQSPHCPLLPAGPLMSRHCHRDTCPEKMPSEAGFGGVWRGFAYLFAGLSPFVYLRRQLGQETAGRAVGSGTQKVNRLQRKVGFV